MSQAQRRDEIDMIVDDLLASPERAEEFKRRLRDSLGAPVRRVAGRAHLRVVADARTDPDSLWDNMPV